MRLQIEDLVMQDASGVTYLAVDLETGKTLALRRFFPYGAEGRGLLPDEQNTYNIAVNELASVRHPALREVMGGGCDPIDGVPYIATVWLDEKSLKHTIIAEPGAHKLAIRTVTQLLEVCDFLSQVFAKEAIWVETELHTIGVTRESTGRDMTFAIDPIKWMNAAHEEKGYTDVISLTQKILGAQSRTTSNQERQGIDSWMRGLRDASPPPTLAKARQMLAASIGVSPPTPTRRVIASNRLARPVLKVEIRKTPIRAQKGLLVTSIALALISSMIGCVWFFKDRLPSMSNVRFSLIQPIESKPSDTADAAKPMDATPLETVIPWDNREQLMRHAKQQVLIEGVAQDISCSESGKTIYLLFAPPEDKLALRVAMEVKDTYLNTIQENFKYFIGSKVRISGTVTVRRVSQQDRVEIKIKNLAAIQLAK